MASNEPIFLSDGEVDPISENRIRLPQNRIRSQKPPRVPRERVLAPGGLFWFVFAVGTFVYGAAYLAWQWWHS